MATFEEFDDRYQYFIHGTNNDDVESFFNKGLLSKYGCKITATMTPISNEDIEKFGIRTIEENYTQIHGFKYCYLIKMFLYLVFFVMVLNFLLKFLLVHLHHMVKLYHNHIHLI